MKEHGVQKPETQGSGPSAPVKRVFVLDTNVLMHDPMSLFQFEEHDICLPITVIEEIDNNKKGTREVARNSRQVARLLNRVTAGTPSHEGQGMVSYPLSPIDKKAKGKLLIRTEQAKLSTLPIGFDPEKADNQILQTALYLKQISDGAEVILVTKDIMVAVKARLYGIVTQDYENDKVLDDTDLLPNGVRILPKNFWEKVGKIESKHGVAGLDIYTIPTSALPKVLRDVSLNELVHLDDGKKPFLARVIGHDQSSLSLRIAKDHSTEKASVFKIRARNFEQSFALELLLDPEIDFVTLLGIAGTGKTLLTLAAGLEQVMELNRYSEIIFTRATVPMGEDIGFLPGTEEDKMNPWMGALNDNLEVLMGGDSEDEKPGTFAKKSFDTRAVNLEMLKRHIRVKSMNFMRGRTFLRKFLVIDEAQNLTPKEMKALITRAGPGTKVVCMGNVGQIDTPYLTEGSSGLSYAVEHFRTGDPSLPFGWPHYGHIILTQAVRSRLASQAEKVL